jgi:hypothetical protein
MRYTRVMSVREKLEGIGLVGERRALAVLVLSFYFVLYLLVALADQSGWGRAFGGLAATYGLAAFGLVAGWFWARWYASGIAWSGVMMGVLALVMGGWNGIFLFFLGTHLLCVVCLLGQRMAEIYDLKPAWREKHQLDEEGVIRVRRAVTRAAAALPSLVLWALAPRSDAATWAVTVASTVGLVGLLRMRSFGPLLLGAGGVGAALAWLGCRTCAPALSIAGASLRPTAWLGLAAAAVLLTAFVPFARPIARYLRR